MIETLCTGSARDMALAIRQGRVSCRELMRAHLNQIDQVNPRVNAIVSRIDPERALGLADAADAQLRAGQPVGPLHGLPIAIKDLADAQGLPTSRGSPLFAGRIAERDSLHVERLRRAGAIVIGKTNTSEFGAGSHTFNRVFGVTRNPYDLGKSAGGSSGGAGAALASGMLAIADGSDLGGSLRNPAAFNGVCALRPTPGRVPARGEAIGWMTRLSVDGPMARNVADLALLLSVMAGHDPRDPLSVLESGVQFREPLARTVEGVRIAWGGDLGCMEVEPEVFDICRSSLRGFLQLGCQVDEARPDLSDAMDVFQLQRAAHFGRLARELGRLGGDWRSQVKETVLWNIEQGRKLTADDLIGSDERRARIYLEMQRFFTHYDFLVLPATQVLPFAVELDWVREINSRPMATYLDWMRSCCIITVTGSPAAAVPCGFTAAGMPVGLQIVGRPWEEFGLLSLASAFETALALQGPQPFGMRPSD